MRDNKKGKIPPSLNQFINSCLKGMQKRQPTKLQLRKFYASCLMLAYTRHNFPLKEIAKKAKVSEQLLRKWRTEEVFKKEVEFLTKVYARGFVDMLERKNLSYGNYLYLVEKEIAYYSLGLRNAIATEHGKRIKAVEPTRDSSPEQKRKFIYLEGFAAFIWQYHADRWGSKKERLTLHETTYELLRVADKTLLSWFEEAIKEKDFQSAREVFNRLLRLFKKQREGAYQLKKALIKHNWREN